MFSAANSLNKNMNYLKGRLLPNQYSFVGLCKSVLSFFVCIYCFEISQKNKKEIGKLDEVEDSGGERRNHGVMSFHLLRLS